ncbi:hypothetical protein GCM10022281_03660 [Sphingomonas rosea]|uniref:Uncharacterized protein n=1 Tax=Sphingomonas rosea TaxID=335605 RepID=A0ABP7TLL9_9SPHN
MVLTLLLTVVGPVLTPSALVAQPAERLVSRYTRLVQCREYKQSPKDQDWASQRCAGLGRNAVWVTCIDSATCHYGFGPRPHVSGPFGTGRTVAPVEWLGHSLRGKFVPLAVIIRLPGADRDGRGRLGLVVFRLRRDGTSCVVGEASGNVDARRVAARSMIRFLCLAEPQTS